MNTFPQIHKSRVDHPPGLRTPHSAPRTGFTLIELLVVIAIIGLLAALVVGGAGLASAAKIKSRVTTEREALINAIERYKKAKGFYPPDNPNDPTCVQTPLFYELTGTTISVSGGQNSYTSGVTGEKLSGTTVNSLFGIGGFINSSGDPSNPAENFYTGVKVTQYLNVGTGANEYTVLGVPVSGSTNIQASTVGIGTDGYINPWHYNLSHPVNNHDTYDLWMDVKYSGRTNRISNWSRDPQSL